MMGVVDKARDVPRGIVFRDLILVLERGRFALHLQPPLAAVQARNYLKRFDFQIRLS